MNAEPATVVTDQILPPFERVLLVDLHNPAADWAINAIVALLGAGESVPTWIGWNHELGEGRFPASRAIVRAHEFDSRLAAEADRILFLYRDLRDALASMHRFLQLPGSTTLAQTLVETATSWENCASLSLRYESICTDPEAALQTIARHLRLPLSDVPLVARRLASLLLPDPAAPDCVHVPVGAYRDELPEPIRNSIALAHGAWLQGHGYSCGQDTSPGDPVLPAVKGFEADQQKLLLLRRLGFSPRVILDVGASNGPWSWTCAQVYPNARYYLAEALPHYRQNLMVPNDGQQWHFLSMALGPEDTEITMTVPTGEHGTYSSTALAFGGKVGAETRTVPQRQIDRLVDEQLLEVPDLAKLDVQGYELHVLQGGSSLWGRTEVFIVETSLYSYWEGAPSILDVMRRFDEKGYSLFDIAGEYRSGQHLTLSQLDLIFIRRSGPLARSLGVRFF